MESEFNLCEASNSSLKTSVFRAFCKTCDIDTMSVDYKINFSVEQCTIVCIYCKLNWLQYSRFLFIHSWKTDNLIQQ